MSENIFEFPEHCGPQLVPASAWNSNLRAVFTAVQWRNFRQQVLAKHGHICAFCNSKPKSLDCHEIWRYKKIDHAHGIQSLVKVLPLCKKCHMVCHIGFWSLKGKFQETVAHMMRVRKIDRTAVNAELSEAQRIFDDLSNIEWSLDITAVEDYATIIKSVDE